MNAFRITILVLLTLVIGLMFYAIQVVVPRWQGQYNEYVATQRMADWQQRQDAHRARISQLAPDHDSPEVATARTEDEESVARNQQTINEAEEKSVIEAARLAEQAKQVKEKPQAPASEEPKAVEPPVIGRVAAYVADWGTIMIQPEPGQLMSLGLEIVVTHEGTVICEATIVDQDAESGQFTASVKDVSASVKQQRDPQAGDPVIVSPFLSGRDLRAMNGQDAWLGTKSLQNKTTAPDATAAPIAPAQEALPSLPLDGARQQGNELPEIDAPLIPAP